MSERCRSCRLKGLFLVALAVCCALLAAPTVAASQPGGKFDPPKGYYLSLGDSLSFGLQLDKLFKLIADGDYTPDAFNTGYTDDFAAQMRQIRPDQQVENLSCGGETTDTMINGGCFFKLHYGLPIHVDYSGPQLDAALAFLQSHRGKVSPITVSIGGNDAAAVIAECNADPSCIAQSGLKQHLSDNLDHILGALRAAAPDAEIIVVAYWNATTDRSTDEVWNQYFVQVASAAAARNNARFANAFALIHTTDQICQLTFVCTSGDGHPNDAGYQVIANLVWSVSGYDRLTHH